jgi:ribose-phosphate pyrophosphokinase
LPERLPPHVVFYCSLSDPNRALIELELAMATAVGLGGQRLTLVAPYLCYMRQDKAFHPGEAVSQHVIGRLLARRLDALITVDPHLHRTHRLEVAVPVRCARALSSAPLMADWLDGRIAEPLLVGPDEESAQWVSTIAEPAGYEYCVARKVRLGDREVRVELPERNFSGRNIVLVDDVASTGQTLLHAATQLADHGAATVSVLVTHALFVEGAIERLRKAGVGEISSTDSVPHATNCVHLDRLLADALHGL